MYAYSAEDIVALATAPGISALAIVRLSGADLSSIYHDFSKKKAIDRKAVFSKIYHPQTKKLLDEAIITYFKGPNSYTGEDVIEISCHGGNVVPRSIILAAIDCGARNANPGEFTCRAFLNGKIDILKAEAIATLIASSSQNGADLSLQHILGRVSSLLSEIKEEAKDFLSIIENELNFSEHEIGPTSYIDFNKRAIDIKSKLVLILKSSTFGKEIMSGFRIVILGKPNSGKSSLFNALIGYDRAIVSKVPGTTRDSIESYFDINGFSVCLIDTAGIWESDDFLDKLSVQKTKSLLKQANLYLLLDEKDPSKVLKSHFSKIINEKCILLKSKSDKNNNSLKNDVDVLSVSSVSGQGLSELLTYISTYIENNVNNNSVMDATLITHRQRNLLECSIGFVNDVIYQIDNCIETDILASTLRGFISSIKEVIGEIPNKDILKHIFSNFCIGK